MFLFADSNLFRGIFHKKTKIIKKFYFSKIENFYLNILTKINAVFKYSFINFVTGIKRQDKFLSVMYTGKGNGISYFTKSKEPLNIINYSQ